MWQTSSNADNRDLKWHSISKWLRSSKRAVACSCIPMKRIALLRGIPCGASSMRPHFMADFANFSEKILNARLSRCTLLYTLFLLSLLLLCLPTLGIASEGTDTCPEIYERWMDDTFEIRNRTGARDNPFNEFLEVANWLHSLQSNSGCVATLWMAPGVYLADLSIPVTSPLNIMKCLDCIGPGYANGVVTIDTSQLSGSFFFVNHPLLLKNMTIYGFSSPDTLSLLDEVHMLRKSRFSSSSSEFSFPIDSLSDSDLEAERSQDFLQGSLFMVLESAIVLDTVDLVRHSRSGALIDSYSSNVTFHDVVGIMNERKYEVSQSTSGGTVLSMIESTGIISKSLFMRNQFSVASQISYSFGGGAINVHSGRLTIDSTTFSKNLASVEEGSKAKPDVSFCGGAIRAGSFVNLTISNSTFTDNFLVDFTNSMFMIGGAVCIAQTGNTIITDTIFLTNAADIGGAIGQIPPEHSSSRGTIPGLIALQHGKDDTKQFDGTSRHEKKVLATVSKDSAYLLLKRVTAARNTCYIRGCAFSLTPTTASANWFIEDSVISDNYFVSNSTKLCPKFTNPILQLAERRELAGSAGISMFVRSSVPFPTSLELSNVTMQRNQVTDWHSCALGGGTAISSFGTERVLISNSLISDHMWFGEMNGVVWARQFKSFSMQGSNMTNNWIENWIQPISPILDIQSDTIFLLSEVEFSVSLQSCFFDNNTATQVIYIAEVRSVRLLDIIIGKQYPGRLPLSDEMPRSYLLISNVAKLVVIDGLISVRPPLSHRIQAVSQLQLSNSIFNEYKSNHSTSPFHLSLDGVTRAFMKNATFSSNPSGGLKVSSSALQIEGSDFNFNQCIGDGCAFRASSTSTWIENSVFHTNYGYNGGSISISNGDAFLISSNFTNNLAVSGRGGAIAALKSSLLLQDVHCEDNQANSGGCIAHDSTLRMESKQRWALTSIRSIYSRNIALDKGGAISVYSKNIDIELLDDKFLYNIGKQGGGVIHFMAGHLKASGVIASHNRASNSGSFRHDPETSTDREPLPNSALLENLPSGGVFLLERCTFSLINCSFDGNSASGRGGAIFVQTTPLPDINIKNVVFSNNRANVGGAISLFVHPYTDDLQANITQSSFVKNRAAYGGALDWDVLYSRAPFVGLTSSTPDLIPEPTDNMYQERFERMEHAETIPTKPFLCISDSDFLNNSATGSGGAIFTPVHDPWYFAYRNITFAYNSALTSGATFFWSPNTCRFTPPTFCDPSLCTLLNASSDLVPPPLWGPIQASSSWEIIPVSLTQLSSSGSLQSEQNAFKRSWNGGETGMRASSQAIYGQNPDSDDFDLPSSNWPINTTVYYGDYLLTLGYRDCYNQLVNEEAFLFTTHSFQADCPRDGVICPNVQLIDGVDSFRLLVFSNESQMLPLGPYRPDTENPGITTPVDISLRITPMLTMPYDWTIDLMSSPLSLNLQVSKCAIGSGLQLSSLRDLAMCDRCPINTYNYDGDGQCYLCNDWRETATAELTCVGSTVSFMEDFWATIVHDTNAIFVGRCLLGFCERGHCAPGRTGTLCGACNENFYESLFAFCSPDLCKSPNVTFFILLCACFAIIAASLHAVLLRWPAMTMFVLYCTQMALLLLQYPLDWAIPRAAPWLAHLLCGFRTGPLTRAVFLTFAPFVSIVFLWLPWLLIQPLRLFISRFQALSINGAWFDTRRVAMTSFAICFALTSHVLKMTVDWFQCYETPLGTIWGASPSESCHSPKFRSARLWSSLVGFPLALLPLLASVIFVVRAKALPKWQTGLQATFRVSSTTRQFFHFLQTSSPYWPIVEILSRVIVPVIIAFAPPREVLMSSCLGLLFAFVVTLSIPFSPFIRPLQRHCASSALALLGILGLFRVDLIYGKKSIAPLLVLLFVLIFMISLILLLIVGRPSKDTKSLPLEGFEDFSHENEDDNGHLLVPEDHDSDDESKSLLSFSSADMESDTDAAAEELATEEDELT